MTSRLSHALRWVVPGASVTASPVVAETPDSAGGAPIETVASVWGQLAGFEALTSEALLLTVFILLLLAVIAHKPKLP